MANKLFEMVAGYDDLINDAWDAGDERKANLLQKEQDLLVDKIEELGLREQFDEYIINIA